MSGGHQESIPFDPDWTVAPSAVLCDWMQENRMTVGRLAVQVAVCGDHNIAAALATVRRVLGRQPFSEGDAAALATVTDIPASLWLAHERMYRDDLAAGRADATEPVPLPLDPGERHA